MTIDSELITARTLRQRFGGVSEMTIWRWARDEALAFPAPIKIRKQRYWRIADIQAFEARQAEGSR